MPSSRRTVRGARLGAAALAVALAVPLHAQHVLPDAQPWYVEAGVGALRLVEQGSSNVTTGGSAPMATLRVGRFVRPRLAVTMSAAYGSIGDARTEVYERPAGPTRSDRYDYRALVLGAGLEYVRPFARLKGVAGLEAGWAWDGWRLVSHEDAASLGPPASTWDGGPEATLRLGLRHPITSRVLVSGVMQLTSGVGTLEGTGSRILPEIALRWRF